MRLSAYALHMRNMPTVQDAGRKLRTKSGNAESDLRPIMYSVSGLPDTANSPQKTFKLALSYALSMARQEDIAVSLSIEQSTVSRWAQGACPKPGQIEARTRQLARFIERRSRKSRDLRRRIERGTK